MKATLIRVLREIDNNQFTKVLASYYKEVELLIPPQINTRIKDGNIRFHIDSLTQELNSKTIILHEFVDIHYRYNRHDEGFKKERNNLSDHGWLLLDYAPVG